MNLNYQVILFKAKFVSADIGWQIDEDEILWKSERYTIAAPAIQEFDFHEPEHTNWFATMVEWDGEEVNDEEIFDSSVIVGYNNSPL